MLTQGTLGRSDSIFSGPPSWLRDGNIVITAATEAKFDTWYRANSGISAAGKTLTEWAQWAAARTQPRGTRGAREDDAVNGAWPSPERAHRAP